MHLEQMKFLFRKIYIWENIWRSFILINEIGLYRVANFLWRHHCDNATKIPSVYGRSFQSRNSLYCGDFYFCGLNQSKQEMRTGHWYMSKTKAYSFPLDPQLSLNLYKEMSTLSTCFSLGQLLIHQISEELYFASWFQQNKASMYTDTKIYDLTEAIGKIIPNMYIYVHK